MKLGVRVTIVTTMLVAPVLGALGFGALKVRRADLEADLDRQAREVAEALRAGIEPLPTDTDAVSRTLTERAWMSRERDDPFKLEVLRVGDHRETTDQSWLVLSQAAEIDDGPVGRLLKAPGREPTFAMAVPLHDARRMSLPHLHPARKPTAILGMRRDARYIDDEVAATARRIFPLFLGVVIFVAVGVLLALRATVTLPLRRLLEGIDAVGKGDLSRVLLAERDDEIGTLAGRFNAMTGSLREAREEGERAVQARLALETRLRQAEKLATIGQMAAEIAHEVGTPLNVIGGRARALGKGPRAGDPAEVMRNAGIIAGEVDRITKIIRQVLDFSRQRGPTVTSVRLGAVVTEALAFLDETITRQGIAAEVHLPPALPDVPGDPDQIQQVCLNLLMNAIHAMPDGGRLRVAAQRVTRRKEGLDLAAPADYAMLEIADTGPGVPVADRSKIFEPFFTTKDEGQGTGLGLAVSHGIVKDHDGWIEVDSPAPPPKGSGTPGPVVGPGAVFRVFLPCAASASASAATSTWRSGAAADDNHDGATGRAVVALAEADRMGKD
jgi:signal transduction histidine kinase